MKNLGFLLNGAGDQVGGQDSQQDEVLNPISLVFTGIAFQPSRDWRERQGQERFFLARRGSFRKHVNTVNRYNSMGSGRMQPRGKSPVSIFNYLSNVMAGLKESKCHYLQRGMIWGNTAQSGLDGDGGNNQGKHFQICEEQESDWDNTHGFAKGTWCLTWHPFIGKEMSWCAVYLDFSRALHTVLLEDIDDVGHGTEWTFSNAACHTKPGGVVDNSIASRLREVILSLYSAQMNLQYKRDMDVLKRLQQKATQIMRLENENWEMSL